MTEPASHLVHTTEGALEESTGSPSGNGADGRRADSSAVEHCFHTAGAGGSIPSPRTIDNLAAMLSDEAWRMNVESRFWPKVAKPLQWDAWAIIDLTQ